jgi:hypothetical protein
MMSKNRPYIPPPKMTPPNQPNAAEMELAAKLAAEAVRAPVEPARPAVELAIVPPPARIASMKILPDRVEFTNPTIDLAEYIWLKHTAKPEQVNKLMPDRAVVAHGLIVIEEYRIAIPLAGARIRT